MKAQFKYVRSPDWDDPVESKKFQVFPDDWKAALESAAEFYARELADMTKEEATKYLDQMTPGKYRLIDNETVEITLED